MPLSGVDPERDFPVGVLELFSQHCDLLAEELLDPVGRDAAAQIRLKSTELRPLLSDMYRSGTAHDRGEIEDAARRLRVPGNAVRLWTRNKSLLFETPPHHQLTQSEGPVWVGSQGTTHYVVHSEADGSTAYAVPADGLAAAVELALYSHVQLERVGDELRSLEDEQELLTRELEGLQRSNADLQEQLDLLQIATLGGVTARLIKGHRDAERVAAEWMSAFGFRDVRLTPSGSDAGVDVESCDGFAQVKLEANRTSRPALQQLVGACAKRNGQLLFFSNAGYTAQALEYAEAHGIAAFEFDYAGLPRPKSRAARGLIPPRTTGSSEDAVRTPTSEVPHQQSLFEGRRASESLNIHDLPPSWGR